jgi:hypothetical protein
MYQLATAPQSIGGVLDAGFRLFKASLAQTFLLAALGALSYVPLGLLDPASGVHLDDTGVIVAVALGVLALIAFGVATSGAIIARIDAIARGRALSLQQALAVGVRRGPALFAASACYGLAVLAGTILALVPGLLFMISLAFAPYASVTEGLGAFASLRYSRQLVRGHWWRTAGLLTVISIVVFAIFAMLAVVVGIVAAVTTEFAATGVVPWYFQLTLSPLLSAVATPLLYAMLMAVYRDLKLRHEGADLAQRIAAASG